MLADRLEDLVRRRHRRRLHRAGWDAALDARAAAWAADGLPPRPGNAVELLIDGAAALPAIAAAVARATDHVHLAHWAAEPAFAVLRDEEQVTLRELLATAAERVDVRFLLWTGAPVPLAHPWHREARRALRELCRGTQIRGALGTTGRWAGACHEKVAVIDGREAFVGGIDPTTLEGDRYDRGGHADARRPGWHDAAAHVRGPAVADVAEHFRCRWRAATGQQLRPSPPPPAAGASTVQIQRTVAGNGACPRGAENGEIRRRGDFSALEGHLAALRGARRLIHLESQFLWSPEIVDALAHKLRDPPDAAFRVVAVLPPSPRMGYDATPGQLAVLSAADGGAGHFLACSLRTAGPGPRRPVYVHAKVLVVDDAWLSVGSLNLSDHSLLNAVEVQLVTDDPQVARSARERLWAEHLDLPPAAVRSSLPHELFDRVWHPTAEAQLARERASLPLTARIVRLPPGSASHRVLGALQTLALGR